MASRRNAPATFRRPMKPGALAGLQAAIDAVQAPHVERTPEQLLAECEQRRRDAESRTSAQPSLALVVPA